MYQIAAFSVVFLSIKVGGTQCGNSKIFLSIGFYVNSSLAIFEPQKLLISTISETLNVGKFQPKAMHKLAKLKIHKPWNSQNIGFWDTEFTKIDFT